ncbi:MAG: ribonuclease PH, partial [Pseudomonadota bacterium]|nr:ribonuclease PH [Pseudomonadota bacterium]
WVALKLATDSLVRLGSLDADPITGSVAAVSCGIFDSTAILDLDYQEDSNAQADANFVLTGGGGIVEIQGTAEDKPFSEEVFLRLLELSKKGIGELTTAQTMALA